MSTSFRRLGPAILLAGLCCLPSVGCHDEARRKIWGDHLGAIAPFSETHVEFAAERKPLTDADVADVVPALRQMGTVDLIFRGEMNVTDAAMADVATLPDLRRLSLTGTQVTPAGVQRLANMRSLKKVVLDSAKFSAEDVERLRVEMPHIAIDR